MSKNTLAKLKRAKDKMPKEAKSEPEILPEYEHLEATGGALLSQFQRAFEKQVQRNNADPENGADVGMDDGGL
jgi:hypothetical protein